MCLLIFKDLAFPPTKSVSMRNLDGNQPNAEKKTKKQIGLPILHLPQLVGLALGFDEKEMELQRHIVPTESVARKVKVNCCRKGDLLW